MGHLGTILDNLGAFLAHLGAILAQLGAILGPFSPSWDHIGPSWVILSHLVAILGHLESSWAISGPWAPKRLNNAGFLDSSCFQSARLGPSWAHLGLCIASAPAALYSTLGLNMV